MRPVLFVFYTIETIMNMFLMSFHIKGFLSVSLNFMPLGSLVTNYLGTVCLYIFTVLTIFASINVCTGQLYSMFMEVTRCLLASVSYIALSLSTLHEAEVEFYLMYLEKRTVEKEIHPFIVYMRYQAMWALSASFVYMLHCIIVIDVLLSNQRDKAGNFDVYNHDDEEPEGYMPVRLYVLGDQIHTQLEKYEWFRQLCQNQVMPL